MLLNVWSLPAKLSQYSSVSVDEDDGSYYSYYDDFDEEDDDEGHEEEEQEDEACFPRRHRRRIGKWLLPVLGNGNVLGSVHTAREKVYLETQLAALFL